MLLEFCGSGSVDNILVKLRHSLKEDQIRFIGYYVCDALKWLHSQNVIHRDLKAGNILLTNDGQVRLAGFGVSAKLKSKREKKGTIIGTPHWMAPEVMASETFKDQPNDCISDIWSFGITLIEMARGEPPHLNVSAVRVIIKVQESDPPALLQPSNWTKLFSELLSKCLIKDPRKRPSATQIFSHPWFNDAPSKRKMILDLLAEMNADVQEEVVIDAYEDSVGGSDDISRRPGGDSWSSALDSPPAATNDGFQVPISPPTYYNAIRSKFKQSLKICNMDTIEENSQGEASAEEDKSRKEARKPDRKKQREPKPTATRITRQRAPSSIAKSMLRALGNRDENIVLPTKSQARKWRKNVSPVLESSVASCLFRAFLKEQGKAHLQTFLGKVSKYKTFMEGISKRSKFGMTIIRDFFANSKEKKLPISKVMKSAITDMVSRDAPCNAFNPAEKLVKLHLQNHHLLDFTHSKMFKKFVRCLEC